MSDTQPTTALPLEIFGLIVDSLAEDDEKFTTIRACSFVSGAFLPLTRKHIFASIEVNNPPSIKAFVTLIRRKPEIGEYVRKLEYAIYDEDTFHLQQTLGKLRNLKYLLISRYWDNRFKHLTIEKTDIVELHIAPSAAPLPPKSVYLHEYTSLDDCASATKKIAEAQHPDGLPVVDFTELATITADCDNKEDIDAIQTILMRTNQLQNLNLKIFEPLTYADIGFAKMVMGSIGTLKTLTLAYTTQESSEDLLSHLCHELGTISGHSVIETLSIFIRTDPDSAKRGDGWGSLDKVLTEKNAWLGLKEFSLEIQIYSYLKIDDMMAALNNLPNTQFKELSASGTINFKFKVTRTCC